MAAGRAPGRLPSRNLQPEAGLCILRLHTAWKSEPKVLLTGNIGTEVRTWHTAGHEIPSWKSTVHPWKSGKCCSHACGESPGAARASRIVFAILQAVTREIPNPSCKVSMEVLRGISEETR